MQFIQSSPFAPWIFLGVSLALAALAVLVLLRLTKTAGQLAAVRRALAEAQTRDGLTGLLTPRQFGIELDEALLRCDFKGGAVCLLYVDVDHFRLINEAYGKDAGDLVLREVADRIKACFAENSALTRVVGNEFVLLVSGNQVVGRQAASTIANAFAKPISDAAWQVHLTCSIGIAVYPSHAERRNAIERAAMAMRSVKVLGGNGYAEYDQLGANEVRESASLTHDLRVALERKEFELYYQPKIDARSLQITAAEVLIRWRHPLKGLVGPDKFIPLAERYGMIQAIGRWVIEQACQQAMVWRQQGLRMRIAVNISGHQMRQDDFVEHLAAVLTKTNTPAARFTCEITESVALEDTSATMQTFDRLRVLGVHVSIDDFGTGHSSLASLRKLPAAELKIDRAFVTDLERSEHAQYIANTIVQMAHALDMRVVAEGVETRKQRDLLVDMGCDELQGYLFAKPMPAEELGVWAAKDHGTGEAMFRPSLYLETETHQLNDQY